jgi:hypothetical protein
VKVLFVGCDSVMVKIQGEPLVDYDPKEYPYGNLWLTPDRFSEASGVLIEVETADTEDLTVAV